MVRVFVDSSSSILQSEKEALDVEVYPLRYLMGDKEYRDGIDMTLDEFYEKFIGENLFPKTSLPNLEELRENVEKYTNEGDDVIVLTLSSGISGTFSAIKSLFSENEKVHVVDTETSAGCMRILVQKINSMKDRPIDEILAEVHALIPRLVVLAIPENLNYLLKGGRLSKAEWMIGSILNIKPVISLPKFVKVVAKKPGLKLTMKHIASLIAKDVDLSYPVIPSYTYNDTNLKKLISYTDEAIRAKMTAFDNIDPVLACHWGPNAFGYIYVKKAD